MVFMQASPKGRVIEHVEGDPGTIMSRGAAMTRLGGQMLESADVLEDIATRAIEDGTQKGKAIETLRETIGESYTVLREAGELYEPVGPVIQRYGEGLEGVQPQIDHNADRCEELWQAYAALPGNLEPRGAGGLFQPDEGSEEAEQNAEEDAAKKAAYDAWEDQAGSYDFWYDSWERIYDNAVEGVTEEVAGSIKDGFWEFLDNLGEILGWAAFVVGVIALFVAGPFAAIALALAAAYFLVTAIQWAGGRKSLLDVALAAVAIIPITKVTHLTKLLHFNKAGGAAFVGGITKGVTSLTGATTKIGPSAIVTAFRSGGMSRGLSQLLTGNPRGFTSVYRAHKAFYEGANAGLAAIRNGTAVRNLAALDFGAQTAGTVLGHVGRYDRINSIPGVNLPETPDRPKWLGLFI
jgi:hypothetical protein